MRYSLHHSALNELRPAQATRAFGRHPDALSPLPAAATLTSRHADWLRRLTALYSLPMCGLRWTLALLLLLAFVLGSGSYAPQTVAAQRAGEVADGMHPAMTAVDAAMPVKCGMCAAGELAKPACLPVCISAQVILPEGLVVPVHVTKAPLSAPAEERVSGSAIRPDPYPPKLTLLA